MPDNIPFEWSPASNLQIWGFNANSQPSCEVGVEWKIPDGTGVGPSLAMASKMAEANPDAMVSVINAYRGGHGIANWGPNPPSYNFRQAISANVNAALASLGENEIEYFIFGGCEADANSQSQTIKQDVDQLLFAWLEAQPWFGHSTMSYIRGMSPWAQSAPGNGDYMWRRYSKALEAVAAINPARRAFVSIEDLPIGLFDSGSSIPYIHMTGAGYHASGLRMGSQIINGVHSAIQKANNLRGKYVAGIVNAVNCSIDPGYGSWRRIGDDDLLVGLRISANVATLSECSFDFTLPIKTKGQPEYVIGLINGVGVSGLIAPSPNPSFLRATFLPRAAGVLALTLWVTCTIAPSDALPNAPL